MSIEQRIKKYSNKGKESAINEIRNLTSKKCFNEISYKSLTQKMKDCALSILMFMIMKQNGNFKSRGVADGHIHRIYTNKNKYSSTMLINYYLICNDSCEAVVLGQMIIY